MKIRSLEEYVERFKRSLDKSATVAFIIGVISTISCHLYFFTNFWANEDSLFSRVVEAQMVGSGRWMPGNLLSEYFSPVVLLFVTCLLMGLISYMVVNMFKIKNKMYAILIALLLTTFPVLAVSFGYNFMIERYMIGLFLSILAVYIAEKYKYGFVTGGLCLTISLAYYQSYITVSITLVMILIILKLFEIKDAKRLAIYIGKYLAMGILGVVIYLLTVKLGYKILGIELLDYKGMNNIGSIPPINMWPKLFLRTYGHVVLYIFGKKFFYPMAVSIVPQVLLSLVNIVLLIKIIKSTDLRKLNVFLLIVLCIAFPFGLNTLDFIIYESNISVLNIYQFVFVFVLPFILMNYVKNSKVFKTNSRFNLLEIGSALMAILVLWSNFSLCNLYYTKLDDYSNSTKSLSNRIIDRIETHLENRESAMVFVGNRYGIDCPSDPTKYYRYILSDQGLWGRYIGYSTMNNYSDYKVHILFNNLYGKSYIQISDEEKLRIINSEEYENMPVWPREGSVKYFEDVLVVKLS